MRKLAKILLLAGALVFLAQTSLTSLIHNHPEDLHSHYDCPAYILSVTLQTFAFSFLIIFSLQSPLKKRLLITQPTEKQSSGKLFFVGNRAPPF